MAACRSKIPQQRIVTLRCFASPTYSHPTWNSSESAALPSPAQSRQTNFSLLRRSALTLWQTSPYICLQQQYSSTSSDSTKRSLDVHRWERQKEKFVWSVIFDREEHDHHPSYHTYTYFSSSYPPLEQQPIVYKRPYYPAVLIDELRLCLSGLTIQAARLLKTGKR